MNPAQILQQFQDFKTQFTQGNPGVSPQDYIQKLLNSGKVTQAQFEQARNLASVVGVKL